MHTVQISSIGCQQIPQQNPHPTQKDNEVPQPYKERKTEKCSGSSTLSHSFSDLKSEQYPSSKKDNHKNTIPSLPLGSPSHRFSYKKNKRDKKTQKQTKQNEDMKHGTVIDNHALIKKLQRFRALLSFVKY